MRILSGVFDGLTTGTPIGLLIDNVDAKSKDYSSIAEKFRPGHADYTYWKKYGIRDYRGGGRSSARETAMRVAAGAIARKILTAGLGNDITIKGALTQMGPHQIDRNKWDWDEIDNNPFFCPDVGAAERWTTYLEDIRKQGSSVGAVIEVVAGGMPPGLGAPVRRGSKPHRGRRPRAGRPAAPGGSRRTPRSRSARLDTRHHRHSRPRGLGGNRRRAR